jgi:hypothetical protein
LSASGSSFQVDALPLLRYFLCKTKSDKTLFTTIETIVYYLRLMHVIKIYRRFYNYSTY